MVVFPPWVVNGIEAIEADTVRFVTLPSEAEGWAGPLEQAATRKPASPRPLSRRRGFGVTGMAITLLYEHNSKIDGSRSHCCGNSACV